MYLAEKFKCNCLIQVKCKLNFKISGMRAYYLIYTLQYESVLSLNSGRVYALWMLPVVEKLSFPLSIDC